MKNRGEAKKRQSGEKIYSFRHSVNCLLSNNEQRLILSVFFFQKYWPFWNRLCAVSQWNYESLGWWTAKPSIFTSTCALDPFSGFKLSKAARAYVHFPEIVLCFRDLAELGLGLRWQCKLWDDRTASETQCEA